jgi:hypothetical protein
VKILFAPFETAGVAGAMRDGLRARGHETELWTIAKHPFISTEDRLVRGYGRRALAGVRAPLRWDVLHFQFGSTFAEYADAAWSRVAGRPLVLMHYWGDDCRIRTGAGLRPLGAGPEWDRMQLARERVIRRRMRLGGRLCAAAVVSDLELLGHVRPFYRTVYVLPTPVVVPLGAVDAPAEPLEGDGPIVLHAPSHQLKKGSAVISSAMDSVAARRPLRPHIVSGVRRDALLRELARADIVVDQLNSVTSGVFALEAMAFGKPVLLEFQRELLAPFARDSPAVAITAATLAAELEALAGDAERRAALGAAGRAFVARVHGADVVARVLEELYEHASTRAAGCFEAAPDGIRPLPSPQ